MISLSACQWRTWFDFEVGVANDAGSTAKLAHRLLEASNAADNCALIHALVECSYILELGALAPSIDNFHKVWLEIADILVPIDGYLGVVLNLSNSLCSLLELFEGCFQIWFHPHNVLTFALAENSAANKCSANGGSEIGKCTPEHKLC